MTTHSLPRMTAARARALPVPVRADTPVRHLLVRDLILPFRIGVKRRERGKAQRVAINLDISVFDRPVTRDRLSEVTNYEAVVDGVRRIAAEDKFNLVETLAEKVAALCLAQTDVVAVRVRVEKLEVFADAAGVGVEIERRRSAESLGRQ